VLAVLGAAVLADEQPAAGLVGAGAVGLALDDVVVELGDR